MCIRKKFKERTATQLHYQLYLIVYGSHLRMERIVVAAIIFLHVRTERVTAHCAVEELAYGHVFGQLQTVAHLGTFQSEHRLMHPVVCVEHPAHEHLLGRVAVVRCRAVEVLGEVDGEGL